MDYDTNLLINIYLDGSRAYEYLFKDVSSFPSSYLNKYFAVSDKGGRIVSDFVQITEVIPTEKSSQPVDCISDFSIANNECLIQLNDNVWDKYSSIAMTFYGVVKFTRENGSWEALPVDALNYQGLYDSLQFTNTLSKEDGYNVRKLFDRNILETCFQIKMKISAIESDTGLLASSEVIYNINPVSENQGSVTADTYPPQMELSVLTPDERFSLFGNAEECIDNYLKVTAKDFYTDGNNVFFSDLNHFELYINDKKIADFKPEELSHPENNVFGMPLYGRYYDENNKCSCKLIAYDNNNNYVEKIIDTVNSYKDVAKIRNWSYSNGICEVHIADNYEGNDYRLRVYKLQGKKWEYVTTYSSGTPSYRNHRFCVDVLPDSIYKFVPELKISNCLCFHDTFIVNTSAENSGNYDIFLKNGTQANSYVISSDQCVFVQTITTLEAYDTCKNWDAATWEANFPRHVGDAALNFSPSDHSPQSYTVPIDKIHEGECYIVIAHYADGSIGMSEVMQR